MTTTLIHDRVAAAREGTNPTVICRARSGWVVLGDRQFLAGYSLLLPDPVVESLNDLDESGRMRFLLDMTALGDALLVVTPAFRINYSILGNTEAALHAHVFARHVTEPEANRKIPVWCYTREKRESVPFDLDRDRPQMDAIASELAANRIAI